MANGGGGHETAKVEATQPPRSAWIYAAALSGLIAVFIIAHFTTNLMHRSASTRRSKPRVFSKALVSPFRYANNFFHKL